MKKLVAIIMLLVTILMPCYSLVSQAKVGDVIGTALHTDIVAYINHYAIPSYAVNGQSVIVAEDLKNFGFDVFWNEYERTLSISRNNSTKVTPMDVLKDGAPGTKFTNILATDIKVYASGRQITSYAMNGYTMIPMEELTMFGNVYWVAGERALKLWVDGLHSLESKQKVTPYADLITTIYSPNGTPTVVLKSEVKAYLNQGWSLTPPLSKSDFLNKVNGYWVDLDSCSYSGPLVCLEYIKFYSDKMEIGATYSEWWTYELKQFTFVGNNTYSALFYMPGYWYGGDYYEPEYCNYTIIYDGGNSFTIRFNQEKWYTYTFVGTNHDYQSLQRHPLVVDALKN